jgi:hypothetical protein
MQWASGFSSEQKQCGERCYQGDQSTDYQKQLAIGKYLILRALGSKGHERPHAKHCHRNRKQGPSI